MNVVEALIRLAEHSGENALVIADPNDGLACVVRFDDKGKRLAFMREDHEEEREGEALALALIAKAARYQSDQAKKRGELARALRLLTLHSEIENCLDD